MEDGRRVLAGQTQQPTELDPEIIKDTQEFSDVYLSFVYRLATKQYEQDYQAMLQLIAEDEKPAKPKVEPKPKHAPKTEETQADRDFPRTSNHVETKGIKKTSNPKVKPQYGKRETFMTETDMKEARDDHKPVIKRLVNRTDVSSDGYSSKLDHNYRKLANDNYMPDVGGHIRKPSFKPSIPKASGAVRNPEINRLLQEAENKKQMLQLQLRNVESDIQKLKKAVVRPRAVYSDAESRPYLAPIYRNPTPPVVQQEPSRDREGESFREDLHSENSSNHPVHRSDYQYSNYKEFNPQTRPRQLDNAAFVKKLNEERKEREVV